MTTKNDLQTLQATLDDFRDSWDALHDVDYELETIQMFLEEMIIYNAGLCEIDGHGNSQKSRVTRKIDALTILLQQARTKLQSQTSIMHHLILQKSTGFVQELIQTEDNKSVESNGTKKVNLLQ